MCRDSIRKNLGGRDQDRSCRPSPEWGTFFDGLEWQRTQEYDPRDHIRTTAAFVIPQLGTIFLQPFPVLKSAADLYVGTKIYRLTHRRCGPTTEGLVETVEAIGE